MIKAYDRTALLPFDVMGNAIEVNDKGSRTTYAYDIMGNVTKLVHYPTNSIDKSMLTTYLHL